MKKLLILLGILYMLSTIVYANDSIIGEIGNTIYPISDTSVQMVAETVEIKMKEDRIYVRCEFVLKKSEEKEKIMVGFPAYSSLFDFQTYINGKKSAVTIKKGLKEEAYPNEYVWEMTFDEEDVYKVVNTYWMDRVYDEKGWELIKYIVKSGATWNEPIHYGKVTIEYDKAFDPENLELIDYDIYKNNEDVKVKVLPEEKKIIWEFYELDPDFDIIVYDKDYIKIKQKELLEKPYDKSEKEKGKIQNLAKKVYDDYLQGNYDVAWENMNKVEQYKNHADKQVSKYALKVINLLDYYRAMILMEKGKYKESAYYFKTNGIFDERNLYKLATLYKMSGDTDQYIQVLNKIIKLQNDNQGIVVWAEQEINHLPTTIKEKYEIKEKNLTMHKEKTINQENKEKKKDRFSYRSFILVNSGIFILFFVVYWNIKKE
ncbi:tetratricopeptide repeat protein [Marinisporobacter balticus]|uniref:Tetratricopeptide repeat protein n=1 Tax=Marinisporobacter balticus TaxID=2018667 RepID=A0A4V2SB59_9FIRM|nr:hypothetical protein [Marinisporobacter balticus]TCO73790.1 hypothetical protein EV214_11423 [Marinisporobacter balticus]